MKFDKFFGSPEDREIVLAAVTQNGEALEFAPKWCQDEVKWVKWWVSCDVTRPRNPPKAIAFIGREMGPPKFQRQSLYIGWWHIRSWTKFLVGGWICFFCWMRGLIHLCTLKTSKISKFTVFTLNWLYKSMTFYQKWLFHQSFRNGCSGVQLCHRFCLGVFFDQRTIWGSTWAQVMLHGFAPTVVDRRKRWYDYIVKVYMDVSENSRTPKSSIFIGFSIVNHPFWGTTIFGNTYITLEVQGY